MLVFLIVVPIVSADIAITGPLEELYNLGDIFSASVYITPDKDIDGLVKTTLQCDNYNLPYYIIPINIKTGREKKISIPELTASRQGSCVINVALQTTAGDIVEETNSNSFRITAELNLTANLNKEEFLQGEDLTITGSVKSRSGEDVEKATLTVELAGKRYTADIKKDEFSYTLNLGDTESDPNHILSLSINDSKGNSGEEEFGIAIKPVAAKLENEINRISFRPLETLELTALLYDMAGEAVNDYINFILTDPAGKKLFEYNALSYTLVKYTFAQDALPGNYQLKAYINNVNKEDTIKVEEVRDLDITIVGNIVYVKNIGNVRYNDQATIILETDDGSKYLVNKKIKLEPAETAEFDLSKEVPTGEYNVIVESEVGTEEEVITDTVSEENIPIEDGRSVYKKTKQGLIRVTGATIAAVNSAKGIFASIFMVIIILSTILYYSRDYLKKKIKGFNNPLNKPEHKHVREEIKTAGTEEVMEYGTKGSN